MKKLKCLFFALYDLSDNCLGIFDSQKELAVYIGKTDTQTIRNSISRKTKIRINNDTWGYIFKFDERELSQCK